MRLRSFALGAAKAWAPAFARATESRSSDLTSDDALKERRRPRERGDPFSRHALKERRRPRELPALNSIGGGDPSDTHRHQENLQKIATNPCFRRDTGRYAGDPSELRPLDPDQSMHRQPAVYILASQPRGTLYIGVTSNLMARIWHHRTGAVPGFTRTYDVRMLVFYELYEDMYAAITREKQLKKWRREWKVELIVAANPKWRDLAADLGFGPEQAGKELAHRTHGSPRPRGRRNQGPRI